MRLFLLLLISSSLSAQIEPVLWKVQKDTIQQWNYFFGDEFNGTEVNESIWYLKMRVKLNINLTKIIKEKINEQ